MKNSKAIVPIFFGFDERFAKYASVAMGSLIANVSHDRQYRIHVLHTDLCPETQLKLSTLAVSNVAIEFDDVSKDIAGIIRKLPIRDWYSPSTYLRLLIAERFPQYDKAIYIDSDTAVLADVGKLFDISIHQNLVGAVSEVVMSDMAPAGDYVEKVLSINRNRYFNAGMIVINSAQWRKQEVLNQFISLVSFYEFSVAQDQDYLNVICKDKVFPLSRSWNMECIKTYKIKRKQQGIIHYAFAPKPWHDRKTPYSHYFWKFAKKSPFFSEIREVYHTFPSEELAKEKAVGESVMNICRREINRPDNFAHRIEERDRLLTAKA
jgi:lipopolysaccharide biosynthesis glycosyltransferase